jgi:hypothetical protein
MSKKEVLKFQKDCFVNYIADIRNEVPAIPNPYIYPDGNPIRPVIPVKTCQNSIMLVGAFPSARFERRGENRRLIPTGNNLSPFGHEKYFDGEKVRTQPSRDSLDENYFSQLGIDPDKIWITDIVKIYLYPEKHIKNCKEIAPQIKFVNTHKLFPKIAKASRECMKKEIKVCNPKLIITLGEVAARTISDDKKTSNKILLNGEVRQIKLDKTYKIAHLGHPEIRRRNKEWDSITEKAIKRLSYEIERL